MSSGPQRFTSVSDATNPAPEVSRAALEVKAGRLHQIGFPTPLTGWMVDAYPDGSLQSRSAVSNGLLHGLSEGRYTNGQVQIAEQFKQEVSHGVRTKYQADGSRPSEATTVEGVLHGLFRRWHANGELAEQVLMKHGKPDGPSAAYFPSGFLKSRVLMRNGIVLEEMRWKDGEHRDVTSELPATAASISPGNRASGGGVVPRPLALMGATNSFPGPYFDPSRPTGELVGDGNDPAEGLFWPCRIR